LVVLIGTFIYELYISEINISNKLCQCRRIDYCADDTIGSNSPPVELPSWQVTRMSSITL